DTRFPVSEIRRCFTWPGRRKKNGRHAGLPFPPIRNSYLVPFACDHAGESNFRLDDIEKNRFGSFCSADVPCRITSRESQIHAGGKSGGRFPGMLPRVGQIGNDDWPGPSPPFGPFQGNRVGGHVAIKGIPRQQHRIAPAWIALWLIELRLWRRQVYL